MLLQEDLPDEARGLEVHAIGIRERVGAHELDDVEQLLLVGEQRDGLGAAVRPRRVHVLSIPGRQRLDLERVRLGPADRREVARVGELGVERPERAGEPQARLGDGLAEVAARRRDRGDERDRALPVRRPERLDPSGALVEAREPAAEVCREALLARQLLQAAADLAEGLRPAARRVGQERDVEALVAEVLGDGDPELDGRLAGGNRHVRGVGDQDGPFEEGGPGARVDQAGEARQELRHLVAPLAAAHVHDDVRVRPARE